jgi:hypothetical protein
MKGDINKYLSGVKKNYEVYTNEADEYFKNALIYSSKNLHILNPVYLNTILSYSKFLISYLKDEREALNILNIPLQHKDTKELDENVVDQESIGYMKEIKKLAKSLNK